MLGIAKLKMDLNAAGRGTVKIDDFDIGHCVTAIEFKSSVDSLTQVKLTIFADVDAEIFAKLENIALAKNEPEALTVSTADGRVLKVRHGAK